MNVTLTATEFDDFVFDMVAQSAIRDPSELPTAVGLIRKLSDLGLTKECPVTEEEERVAVLARVKLRPGRKLIGTEAEFKFTDDELAFMLRAMEAASVRVNVGVLPELQDLMRKLTNGSAPG